MCTPPPSCLPTLYSSSQYSWRPGRQAFPSIPSRRQSQVTLIDWCLSVTGCIDWLVSPSTPSRRQLVTGDIDWLVSPSVLSRRGSHGWHCLMGVSFHTLKKAVTDNIDWLCLLPFPQEAAVTGDNDCLVSPSIPAYFEKAVTVDSQKSDWLSCFQHFKKIFAGDIW